MASRSELARRIALGVAVAHLMYEGVTTPFTINGVEGNKPE